MATASGNPVAGQGGDNKGAWSAGPQARLVVGVAMLGCVATLATGGSRPGIPAQTSPPARVAVQRVAAGDVFSPMGRSSRADEYERGDFAITRHRPRCNGPAEVYTQHRFPAAVAVDPHDGASR